MVEDGAFSHKIDYVTVFRKIINLKGHRNRLTGLKVTAILLNGWILPIGGASVAESLLSTGPTLSSFVINMTGNVLNLIGYSPNNLNSIAWFCSKGRRCKPYIKYIEKTCFRLFLRM